MYENGKGADLSYPYEVSSQNNTPFSADKGAAFLLSEKQTTKNDPILAEGANFPRDINPPDTFRWTGCFHPDRLARAVLQTNGSKARARVRAVF